MIGVYGGAFDPIHFGHLRIALEVKDSLDMDEIRLLPCLIPPHRPSSKVLVKHRVLMLKLSIMGEDGFVIDTRELERQGPSYTVETLLSLREEFVTTPLSLILGMDAFAGLPDWYRWEELFDLAHIVVIPRPGSPPSVPQQLAAKIQDRRIDNGRVLKTCPTGLVFFAEMTQLDISSTQIRQLIKSGKSPRYLLPDSVWKMIKEQELYV